MGREKAINGGGLGGKAELSEQLGHLVNWRFHDPVGALSGDGGEAIGGGGDVAGHGKLRQEGKTGARPIWDSLVKYSSIIRPPIAWDKREPRTAVRNYRAGFSSLSRVACRGPHGFPARTSGG